MCNVADENLDIEDDEGVPGFGALSAHRCSMVKKYNIETFFSPSTSAKMAAQHKRTATAAENSTVNDLMPQMRQVNEEIEAAEYDDDEQSITLMEPEMQASSEVEFMQSPSGINETNTALEIDLRGTLLKKTKQNNNNDQDGFLSVDRQESLLGGQESEGQINRPSMDAN